MTNYLKRTIRTCGMIGMIDSYRGTGDDTIVFYPCKQIGNTFNYCKKETEKEITDIQK